MTWHFFITTASESSTVSGVSSASSSVKKGPEIASEPKTGGSRSVSVWIAENHDSYETVNLS